MFHAHHQNMKLILAPLGVSQTELYEFLVCDINSKECMIHRFHLNNIQCTLHPVVVYYKDGEALQSISHCIISDDNKHDVGMVYQV